MNVPDTTPAVPIRMLQIGQILRDRRPKDGADVYQDGFVNFYAATAMPAGRHVPFDAGINGIAVAPSRDGGRRPAIIIASSPHKAGSVVTPWEDEFAPNDGYVRYFGDAKKPGQPAHAARGNALLLDQFARHYSLPDRASRLRAAPLIYFQRLPNDGVQKGFPRFQGFGLVTGVRLVTQLSETSGGAFSNYEFDCAVFAMQAEGELFDWAWINARRDSALSDEATLSLAPASWRTWIRDGEAAIPHLRRKVVRRRLTPVAEQIPTPASPDARLLGEIYEHYHGKKVYFESLAAAVAERVVEPSGGRYTTHGVTRGTSDAGIDFIGQLDVGAGFSRAPLLVLGQAKCVAPGTNTSAADLARTVARLRRGWLGVFVTTGAISVKAQAEVYEDRYPLVMITGAQVASTVRQMLRDRGNRDVQSLLADFDREYELTARVTDPERLLV